MNGRPIAARAVELAACEAVGAVGYVPVRPLLKSGGVGYWVIIKRIFSLQLI